MANREEEGLESFDLYLRRDDGICAVVVDDRSEFDEEVDDGIIFDAFVERCRAYLKKNPAQSFTDWEIYIGFWGQWSLTIPASFFTFVVETGIPVTLDLDD